MAIVETKADQAAPVEGYRDSLRDMKRGPGAVTSYSEDFAERVLDGLEDGKGVVAICAEVPNAPTERTVRRWYTENVSEFAPRYARARDIGLDVRAERMIMQLEQPIAPQDVPAKRLWFDAERWYLSKLAPKRYGDQLTLNGGETPLTVQVVDDKEIARRVALLLSRAAGGETIEGKAEKGDGSAEV